MKEALCFFTMPLIFIRLSVRIFYKVIFSNAAKRALKILGQILKLRTGGNADFGIALFLVVLPAANVAKIFFHFLFSF